LKTPLRQPTAAGRIALRKQESVDLFGHTAKPPTSRRGATPFDPTIV